MRGPKGAAVGTLKRVILSDIVSYNCVPQFACIISGIPGHYIEDIKISDVYLHHQGGGTAEMAALQPAENEVAYPDPRMFGRLPARGFFVRHARNLEFSNVEIAHTRPDARPAFWMNDVSEVDLFRVRVAPSPGAPIFKLNSVENLRAFASRGFKDLELGTVNPPQL
jgi:polygalacturonase